MPGSPCTHLFPLISEGFPFGDPRNQKKAPQKKTTGMGLALAFLEKDKAQSIHLEASPGQDLKLPVDSEKTGHLAHARNKRLWPPAISAKRFLEHSASCAVTCSTTPTSLSSGPQVSPVPSPGPSDKRREMDLSAHAPEMAGRRLAFSQKTWTCPSREREEKTKTLRRFRRFGRFRKLFSSGEWRAAQSSRTE